MTKKTSATNVLALLRTSVNTVIAHPVIVYPFCIMAFIQLLVLEVLYFSPRFPLSVFFGPIIARLHGEAFLHYPFNFILLPKLFYQAQIPLYVLAGGFLSATAVCLIAAINAEKKAVFKSALRHAARQYIHIMLAALLTYAFFSLLSNGYGLVVRRAMAIRSETGIYFLIKTVVIQAAPYVSLAIGILATTLFVFAIPIIVLEKRKVMRGVVENFKMVFKSFWRILALVLIPTVLYIPILVLRVNAGVVASKTMPEVQVLVIILSIIVTLCIDATVVTAATTWYLLNKEKTGEK